MNKLFILLALFIFSFNLFGGEVLATHGGKCDENQVDTEFGCFDTDNPAALATRLYGMGLGLVGGVAILFIIYGGYLILASKGDPDELKKGRTYIISAIAGIILAISGFAFYQIIAVDIIKIPGFNK